MTPWTVVEHTADVGLEATGETLAEAIGELVAGFGELVCPEGEVEAAQTRNLRAEARDVDDLVVDLLDRVNYVHQVDHFVPAGADVTLEEGEDGYVATLDVVGEDYDPGRHGHLMEVKATTYHDLEVDTDGRVHVLFDV